MKPRANKDPSKAEDDFCEAPTLIVRFFKEQAKLATPEASWHSGVAPRVAILGFPGEFAASWAPQFIYLSRPENFAKSAKPGSSCQPIILDDSSQERCLFRTSAMLRKASIVALWVATFSLSVQVAMAQQDRNDGYVPPPTFGQRMEALRRNLFGAPGQQQQYQQQQSKSSQPTKSTQSAAKNNKYYMPPRSTQSNSSNFGVNPNGGGTKRTTKPAMIEEQEEDLRQLPRMDVAVRQSRPASMPAPMMDDAPKSNSTSMSARRKSQAPPEPPKTGRRPPTEEELQESAAMADDPDEGTESLRPSYPNLRQSPDADSLRPIDGPTSARRSARLQNNNLARSQPRPEETAEERLLEKTSRTPASLLREDSVLVARKSPSLSVETIGPKRISVGKEATYRLVLKNAGDLVAEDVVVLITIPDFAEVVDAKASLGHAQPADKQMGAAGFVWRLNALAARSEQELALQIVPRKGQPFELGVRWTSSAASSQATVEVQEPKLQLSIHGPKEVQFGDKSMYKLTLANPGTGDAENVVIRLLPIAPGEGGVATHSIGTLAAGESKAVEIELTARQAGKLTIAAEALAEGNLNASATEEVVVRRAALQVAVNGPKAHYAGAPATFEVRVGNAGNASAMQVQVAAILPPQAEFVSAGEGGLFDSKRNEVVWSVDNVRPAGERTFEFKCSLNSAGTNQIEVEASADGGLMTKAATVTKVVAVADLVLSMSDPSGPVAVGQDMYYEARIRNRGTKNADNVDIKAYFSNNINLVSVEGGAEEVEPGTWKLRSIPSIGAGREVVVKIKARADAAGNHRCRVEVKCDAIGVSLVNEESTLFYTDEAAPAPIAVPQGKAMMPISNGVAPTSLNEPRRLGQ